MTKLLPSTPNLHHLCTQAKDLFKLCKLGDPSAVKLIKLHCPTLAGASSFRAPERIRLSDAQHALARSYGFTCWASLSATVNKRHDDAKALTKALMNPRMEDLGYRTEIARRKGLPSIGTSRVSEHGVRYDVADYMIAMAPCRPARSSSGGLPVHVDDLLPIIAFPEMSDVLRELYIETDCVTTKPLVFFDTLPGTHPATAAPGLNQVLTINAEAPLHLLFDAASLHETIIAHELGHIWVEKVEQKEDYRHLRDQSDPSRATQFSHIQSFVMDLCVNDMLMRRGFDMSIIARHEAEGALHFAANCARGEKPKNRRVLAGVISALAGILLGMERFPQQWTADVSTALEILQAGLPEAIEPAKGFVRSVLRNGYADSAAIMRVVDECAAISFAATGESFEPDRDLIEVPNVEPKWDKRPEFLSCVPVDVKLEVCREAAKHGVTGRAQYSIVVRRDQYASVSIGDPDSSMPEPINLSFTLPVPPGRRCMQADPALRPRVGAAHTPPTTWSRASIVGANPVSGNLPGTPVGFSPTLQNPTRPGLAFISPTHQSFGGPDLALSDHISQIKKMNEDLEQQRVEALRRQQLQNIELTRQHSESHDGHLLKPYLTPAGEEYARQHPRRAIAPTAASRNYMAGLGRWISQVGFEQQRSGEPAYGYASNNPVTYFDSSGRSPQKRVNTQSIGKGGSGNSCPGAAAYNLVVATFQRNPACLRAILRVCPYGFASEVAQVPFQQCNPPLTKGESGTACDPNGKNPPPGAQTGKDKQGNQSSCYVGFVCFNPDVCNGKNLPKGATVIGRKAGDLLFEMMNWCNCKYHSQFGGEQPANDVIDICKIPGDTGAHGGGFD